MKRSLWGMLLGIAWLGWQHLPADAQAPASSDAELQQAMAAFTQALGEASKGAAPIVDFRDLKNLLPEAPPDMRRTQVNAERSGFMNLQVAYAEASYERHKGGVIELKISDIGGISGFSAIAQAGWMAAEIDRETETGYERTVTHRGFKGHEQYDSAERSGSIELLIADRFMVELNGRDIGMEALRHLLNQLDLQQLAQLKPRLETDGAAAPSAE